MPHARPLPVLPVDVTVESLGGLGDGIANLDGTPLFIPKSAPGDHVRVRIIHRNRDGMVGQIEEILTPGEGRRIPPCRYFDRCGGCTLQQLQPETYREFKTHIFKNALTHSGYNAENAEVVFISPDTRRRVEFKIDRTGEKPLLAFHEPRSHTPISVSQCLILHPRLQTLIAPINAWLANFPYSDTLFAASLTLADTGPDLMLTFRELPVNIPGNGICEEIEVHRVSICGRECEPQTLETRATVEMQLGDHSVALPPGAFLQATEEGQRRLTDAALSACDGANRVIDLFCGIGSYSFPASRLARTHAAEGDRRMVEAMQAAIARHGISTLTCQQRDLFKKPFTASELNSYDTAIINPPRVGAKAQCEELAASRVRTVCMVSCNPATFTRDARILKAAGFRLKHAFGVDQFIYSPHLELVAILTKD